MAPRQCPKCELRFASADELDDHLARDHAVDPARLPDRHPPPPPQPRPSPPHAGGAPPATGAAAPAT